MADVRINVAIDEVTHKTLKMFAVSQGKPLKEVIIEALKEKADKEKERNEKL